MHSSRKHVNWHQVVNRQLWYWAGQEETLNYYFTAVNEVRNYIPEVGVYGATPRSVDGASPGLGGQRWEAQPRVPGTPLSPRASHPDQPPHTGAWLRAPTGASRGKSEKGSKLTQPRLLAFISKSDLPFLFHRCPLVIWYIVSVQHFSCIQLCRTGSININ